MNTSAPNIEPVLVGGSVEGDRARLEIDGRGMIRHCNAAAERMFGASARTLLGAHISKFVGRFSGDDLVRDGTFRASLSYVCRCGVAFRSRRINQEEFLARVYVTERIGPNFDHVRLVFREVAESDPGNAAGTVHVG